MTTSIPEALARSIIGPSVLFLIGVLVLLVSANWQRDRVLASIMSAALIGWCAFVLGLGRSGFFAANPLFAPWIIFGFLILFGLWRLAYNSPRVEALFQAIPQPWSIGIQTYRLVGYGFLQLYQLGVLPAAFAFPSGLGDMLVGGLAPFVALWYRARRPSSVAVARWWNYLGILDLIVAVGIGILGFPRPIQFVPMTPSTEAIALDPLVIIPLFAVPLALLLHLFSLRALLNKSN